MGEGELAYQFGNAGGVRHRAVPTMATARRVLLPEKASSGECTEPSLMEAAAKKRLIKTSDPAVADRPFLRGRRSPAPAFVACLQDPEQLRIKVICLRH